MNFNGVQVVESALMVKDVVHKRERKWAHRKMWRREKRFNVTTEQVPCIMMGNGVMYAHPAIVQKLKEAVPTSTLGDYL